MPARIYQIDLAQPLPALRLGADRAWLLVRIGRQPVGWVPCRPARMGPIAPDMLSRMITETLWKELNELAAQGDEATPTPARWPMISVVVCTRNKSESLRRQLQSIAQLQYPDFETIVVDNAPVDDSAKKVCEEFPSVRYAIDPRPGVSYARNTGWQAARGDIVAFTDEDACVDPHWLTSLAENYADPSVACVTGVTFPMELATEAQGYFESDGSVHQRGFRRRVYRPGRWNARFPVNARRFGAGVNLSVRRSALVRLAGFDTALDAGSVARGGGDLDIMARVQRDAGGTIVYDPRAICWHQSCRTMDELRHRIFDGGFGFAAFTLKQSHDLELGNVSIRQLRRWSSEQWKRLIDNAKLAVRAKEHFPLHLIMLEIFGGLFGARAYRRSVRKAWQNQAEFTKKGMTPILPSIARHPAGAAA